MELSPRHARPARLVLAVLLALASAVTGLGGADAGRAQEEPAAEEEARDLGNITVLQDGDEIDGVELAIRLNEATEPGPVDTVLLASEATFADGLAATSALAEATLLLSPPRGPLPGRLVVELERLGATTVVLLGGDAAIDDEIFEELVALGYAVERIEGADRVATAVEVARRFAPQARTALLVRQDGPGTAAWADSITAGPLAAELRIPILLTEAGRLSPATARYLADAPISTIIIIGGPAAVPGAVEAQLVGQGFITRRISGGDRFATAEGILEARGLGDYDRLVLFGGYEELGWQGGLASVHHAVRSGAPLLPVRAGEVDPRLVELLETGRQFMISCVVGSSICGEATDASATQLPVPDITFNPPPSSALADGESIRIGVDDPERIVDGTVALSSNCGGELQYLPEGQGFVSLNVQPVIEDGGDQPLREGPVPVQPAPISDPGNGPQDQGAPQGTPEPIDPDEPKPERPPLACALTFTMPRRAGGPPVVQTVTYNVVDLRPRIRISTFPTQARRPIAFTDDSDGIIDRWSWSFGDGRTASEELPEHTYADHGCFRTELTVTSELAHWLTRDRFQASTSRWIAVDPTSSSATHVEVLLRDARDEEDGVPVTGDVINVYRDRAAAVAGAPLLASVTTDSRAMAVFTDLPAGSLVFAPALQPERLIEQEVPRGQTVCFGLSVVDTGNAVITVSRELPDETTEPVSDADVRIQSELTGTLRVPLSTSADDGDGVYRLDEIPAGDYKVSVIVDGATHKGTVLVPDGDDGQATITIKAAEE